MGYLMSLRGSRGNEEDLDSSGAAKILTRIISRDGRKSMSGIEEEKEVAVPAAEVVAVKIQRLS